MIPASPQFNSRRGNGCPTLRRPSGSVGLDGPKPGEGNALPRGLRQVTFDPEAKAVYGITSNDLYRFDAAGNKKATLKPPKADTETGWCCGIAYDRKRERILIATLGGKGELISYVPKTEQWAVVAGMNNIDLAGLAYDASADVLYGLHMDSGRESTRVTTFNANGAAIASISLSDPSFPVKLGAAEPLPPVPQLGVVRGELLIATADRVFAIDVKAAKVRVTWEKK